MTTFTALAFVFITMSLGFMLGVLTCLVMASDPTDDDIIERRARAIHEYWLVQQRVREILREHDDDNEVPR